MVHCHYRDAVNKIIKNQNIGNSTGQITLFLSQINCKEKRVARDE